ncbi:MAG: c-type cytochrome [Magnetococcus sp. YQC-3]
MNGLQRFRWWISPAILLLAIAGGALASPDAGGLSSHEEGRKIYNFRCYFCHGYSGDARTLAATYLSPRPRNFAATDPASLPMARMIQSITGGRPQTAMAGFAGILNETEIRQVAEFVREEFMVRQAENTRYHTLENGWPDHERYADAFPFATGQIPLDRADDALSPAQQRGRALFFSACITCHDRARVEEEGAIWEAHAVSFPRGHYSHREPPLDGRTTATPFARHDQPPRLTGLTPQEQRGEELFQKNCAFCHGGDGTGKQWIGAFLQPHPRDLTALSGLNREQLRQRIREGIPGTAMPAWKEVLKEEQVQDIIHYIARAFHPVADGAATR